MVPQFVKKDVEQHECSRLSLRKTHRNQLAIPRIMSNSQTLQNFPVRIKIIDREVHPQILRPRIEENSTRFFAMVKRILPIRFCLSYQNYPLDLPRDFGPIRDTLNERLDISFRDHMPESPPRRLPIHKISVRHRRPMLILSLHSAILSPHSRTPVSADVHPAFIISLGNLGDIDRSTQPRLVGIFFVTLCLSVRF